MRDDYHVRYGIMIASVTLGTMDTLGLTGHFYDVIIALWAIWRWYQIKLKFDSNEG